MNELKTNIGRNVKAMQLRPHVATGTARTKIQVRSNLTCEIVDGEWTLIADLDRASGGHAAGPDPGVLVRAGLGACLAMGYVMWAARLDIPLERVKVQVETDYDARGMYGVDAEVSPGWRGVRYTTTIISSAPRDRILELVREADNHSPILDDLRRSLNVTGDFHISAEE